MFYKKISKQEIDNMGNKYGFTPNYTYEDYVIEHDEKTGEILEEYYINLTIHKTTDEVYQEWIENKDKPNRPSKLQVLEDENKILKAQVKALNDTTDFQEELIVEMANIVYA